MKIGKRCIFDGRIFFCKYPGSTISIGDECRFNSLTIATQAGICRPCSIWTTSPNAVVKIGSGCGFSGTAISCHMSVLIEDNVRIGSNVLIMDSDQHLDDSRIEKPLPVVICENAWIGSGSIILKGVTIGKNSIIGAGSVVTKNVPDNSIAGGVPAKVLRTLQNDCE